MLGLGEEVTYSYRCLQCQHEDEVPDVVILDFGQKSTTGYEVAV
jgi:hypothetical protein